MLGKPIDTEFYLSSDFIVGIELVFGSLSSVTIHYHPIGLMLSLRHHPLLDVN